MKEQKEFQKIYCKKSDCNKNQEKKGEEVKKQDEKIVQNEVNSQKENKMNIETIESDGEIFGEE